MLFIQNLFMRRRQIDRQGIMMVGPDISRQFRCRPAAALKLAALVMVTGIFGTVASDAAELTPRDIVLLDRLTWGINASSAAHLQGIGAERWLAEQLHPVVDGALPEAARA